ncbi:hypothetical protein [Achromobacter marplatensis]|uniref:hypothetical protein n=1 Tax=Achromobacter marplatensis TaxID=470868 RepID=UPI0028ECA111|nr:hypothetical protein [Achromobacter marplatensis]
MEEQAPTKKAYVAMFEGIQEDVRATIFIDQYSANGAEVAARDYLSNSIDWRCVGVDVE